LEICAVSFDKNGTEVTTNVSLQLLAYGTLNSVVSNNNNNNNNNNNAIFDENR